MTTTTHIARRPMPRTPRVIEDQVRRTLAAKHHDMGHANIHAQTGRCVVFLRDIVGLGDHDWFDALDQLPWAVNVDYGYGNGALIITPHDVDDTHLAYERALDYADGMGDE